MPVSMDWYNNEKTMLLVTFTGDVSTDDFIAAYHQQMDRLESLNHLMVVIADFRAITHMPMGILSASGSLSGRSTNNLAGLVVVGSNTVLRTIMGIWGRLYNKMTMVDTMEKATAWADKHLQPVDIQ